MLHQYNNMPVVDGTGMTDKFDFTLEYSVGLAASPDAEPVDAPDLSRALTQQLGLQIVRRKTPFDFVVWLLNRSTACPPRTDRREQSMVVPVDASNPLRNNGIRRLP